MLISVETLKEYADITNLALEKNIIERHIKDAENIDLRDFLGKPLYYDMLANKNSQIYVNLIKGEDYTCSYNGTQYTVRYNGLQDVLAYWALARIAEFYGTKITAQGLHEDLYEESQEVSRRQRADLAARFRSNADQYQQEVSNYLEENSASYPLYSTVVQKNTSFKSHAITARNKYNEDYYRNRKLY